jgi:hypothetical protein
LAAPTVLGSAVGLYTCGGNYNLVQSTSPAGASYVVPVGGGFITQWSTQAGGFATPLRLQVWRPLPGYLTFGLVGSSPQVTPLGSAVNTYVLAPADRIAVQQGDLLGLRVDGLPTDTALCVNPAPGGTYSFAGGAQPGILAATSFIGQPAFQLNVSAIVDSGTPPPPPPPPSGGGCNSTGNANLSDVCNQTLILRILTAAVRAANL